MELPIIATGRTGSVTFDGRTVTITRSGALALMTGGRGEKRIPVEHVTAVQFKPARLGTNGYIQFTFGGSNELRGRLGSTVQDAMKDENSIVFWGKQQPAFEALRDAIQAAQARPAPVAGVDVAGQLAQLAQLHQAGALNDAEFAAAKARLLG